MGKYIFVFETNYGNGNGNGKVQNPYSIRMLLDGPDEYIIPVLRNMIKIYYIIGQHLSSELKCTLGFEHISILNSNDQCTFMVHPKDELKLKLTISKTIKVPYGNDIIHVHKTEFSNYWYNYFIKSRVLFDIDRNLTDEEYQYVSNKIEQFREKYRATVHMTPNLQIDNKKYTTYHMRLYTSTPEAFEEAWKMKTDFYQRGICDIKELLMRVQETSWPCLFNEKIEIFSEPYSNTTVGDGQNININVSFQVYEERVYHEEDMLHNYFDNRPLIKDTIENLKVYNINYELAKSMPNRFSWTLEDAEIINGNTVIFHDTETAYTIDKDIYEKCLILKGW